MDKLENIENYNPTTQEGDLGRDARQKINGNFQKVKTSLDKMETDVSDMKTRIYAHKLDGGNA